MTGVSKWMSADAAEKYHAEDNYYTKTLGIIRGDKKILKMLGLKKGQKISKKKGKQMFNKLLHGINPKTGKSMFRKNKDGVDRRAGFDVSFSPAKSVSLLYEFGDESTRKSIASAHQKAVQTAMQTIQKHIQVRVPSKDKKNHQKLVATEIVYAEIEHDVSRESEKGTIDPLLHTHNFIMNMGLDVNGGDKIRSIYNDELYHSKIGEKTHLINQIGAEYRLTLSVELEKIGVKMEVTDAKQNFYEVAGVDRKTILHFSQRASDIEIQGDEYLQWKIDDAKKIGKENGWSREKIAAEVKKIETGFGYKDVKIASQANKIAKKNNVDRDALRDENRQRFLDFTGKDPLTWANSILVRGKVLIDEKRLELLKEITPALEILAEKEGTTLEVLTENLVENRELWDENSTEISPLLTNVREALEEKNRERAELIVSLSIRSIEENSSTFTPKKLLEEAMIKAVEEKIAPALLKSEIGKALERGEIVPFMLKNRNIVLSTKRIYHAENVIYPMIEAGKGVMKPLLNAEQKLEMERFRVNHETFSMMNEGQVAMADFIFSSVDRHGAIQGDAGTGKTFSMAFVREAVEKVNPELAKKIIGISFTGKASAGLEADSGIKSRTLDSFLLSEKNRKEDAEGGRIIVVDEATMVGSLKMEELFKVAERNNDRVILIGDQKQFPSVSAGSTLKDMLDSKKISTFELTETMRQKTQEMKDIVADLKNKKWDSAIKTLKDRGSMFEMEDKEAVMAAASVYIDAIQNPKMGKDIVDRSLIIASTNIVRNVENEFIRKALKDKGIIGKEEFNFDTYATINVAGIKQYMVIGVAAAKPDFVRAQGRIKGLDSKEIYEFGGISEDKQSIILLNRNREKIEINIETYGEKLGYFKLEKRDFVENDVIVFTKNDKDLGFKNGMRGKILQVDDSQITVDIDGVIHKVNPEIYPYLDHGYAVTDYKSQGATTGHVIALANSHMATQNSFYTQITRCKYDATIFTKSIERFTQNAHKSGVAQSTVGMKRLPNNVALESLWGRKVPEEDKPVMAEMPLSPKPENPKIREGIELAAKEAITIPDFVKKCKEKGVYVDLRRHTASYDQGKDRVKLSKGEVKELKKLFRKNHAINKKNPTVKITVKIVDTNITKRYVENTRKTNEPKRDTGKDISSKDNKEKSENISKTKPIHIVLESENRNTEKKIDSQKSPQTKSNLKETIIKESIDDDNDISAKSVLVDNTESIKMEPEEDSHEVDELNKDTVLIQSTLMDDDTYEDPEMENNFGIKR